MEPVAGADDGIYTGPAVVRSLLGYLIKVSGFPSEFESGICQRYFWCTHNIYICI
jgi:hypothetical protein